MWCTASQPSCPTEKARSTPYARSAGSRSPERWIPAAVIGTPADAGGANGARRARRGKRAARAAWSEIGVLILPRK